MFSLPKLHHHAGQNQHLKADQLHHRTARAMYSLQWPVLYHFFLALGSSLLQLVCSSCCVCFFFCGWLVGWLACLPVCLFARLFVFVCSCVSLFAGLLAGLFVCLFVCLFVGFVSLWLKPKWLLIFSAVFFFYLHGANAPENPMPQTAAGGLRFSTACTCFLCSHACIHQIECAKTMANIINKYIYIFIYLYLYLYIYE